MLKAKHNFLIYKFFKNYSIRKTNKVFERVNMVGNFNDKQRPVLVICNHISWWDGFWIMYLNLKILHRKFHFMMLEDQLKKYWFFNYSGGFSVQKKSRSVIESLNYTIELLNDKENMVLIFPQGKIHSLHNSNIKFEKGLEWISNKTNDIQILQVANLVDYFSQPKPSLFMYLEEYNSNNKLLTIEKSYQQFYLQCIEKQKKIKA